MLGSGLIYVAPFLSQLEENQSRAIPATLKGRKALSQLNSTIVSAHIEKCPMFEPPPAPMLEGTWSDRDGIIECNSALAFL